MPLRNYFFAKLRHSSCGQYRVMALLTISCVSSSVSNRNNCWFYWRRVAASKAFSLVAVPNALQDCRRSNSPAPI